MNLRNLTDDELESNLGRHVRAEREALSGVLHHLLEVSRRRLYSKYRCENLHQYACLRYGYSEDAAARRITAMYLLKEVPEVASKIESGSVSLTNLVHVQAHFRKEAKANIRRTVDEKLGLLAKLENCSKTEAKQVIANDAETLFRSQGVEIPLSQFDEMPFRPNAKLRAKLKRLRELRPGLSLEELIDQMADLSLKSWDPMEKAKRVLTRQSKKKAKVEKSTAQAPEKTKEKISALARKGQSQKRRWIPAPIRHKVRLRDGDACVQCGARTNLQFDHIEDFARGGSHEVENLRLLCRSCNQRRAIESYGLKKMSPFL